MHRPSFALHVRFNSCLSLTSQVTLMENLDPNGIPIEVLLGTGTNNANGLQLGTPQLWMDPVRHTACTHCQPLLTLVVLSTALFKTAGLQQATAAGSQACSPSHCRQSSVAAVGAWGPGFGPR